MSTDTTAGRNLPWAQVDVFAQRAYEGNMLAIFTDATGLTTEQMQALARETNLSETTFILPADPAEEAADGVRVRIFTPDEELPFAGHPTLGTASWLWANHSALRGAEVVKLNLNVGAIPVRFTPPQPGEVGVYGEMRQRDPEFLGTPDRAALAAAINLSADDLHPDLHPQAVSTGLPFCIVPVRTVEALGRMRETPALPALMASIGARFAFGITPVSDGTWRTRLPFRGGDDPATGSASGCAISYLVHHGAVPAEQPTVFHQGIEVHRPSVVHVRASLHDGTVTNVFVGGRTIPVAFGFFTHG